MINKTDLKMLKGRMEKLETVKEKIAVAKAEFEEEIMPLKDMRDIITEEIDDLKLVIGVAAVEEFNKSGEKSQLGGVKVQEKKNTVVSYTQETALKWAKEKDMFLMLDKKAFEKSAPSLNLPFVTVSTTTEPKATFPKVIKVEADPIVSAGGIDIVPSTFESKNAEVKVEE